MEEAEAGSGKILKEAVWQNKLEAETTNFIRSWKRKQKISRVRKRKQKIFYCFHIPGWKRHMGGGGKRQNAVRMPSYSGGGTVKKLLKKPSYDISTFPL